MSSTDIIAKPEAAFEDFETTDKRPTNFYVTQIYDAIANIFTPSVTAKFQRAVSSSSELHAIQRIPRDKTTLTLLLIILRKADTRGMRESILIVPSVLDFALTL